MINAGWDRPRSHDCHLRPENSYFAGKPLKSWDRSMIIESHGTIDHQ